MFGPPVNKLGLRGRCPWELSQSGSQWELVLQGPVLSLPGRRKHAGGHQRAVSYRRGCPGGCRTCTRWAWICLNIADADLPYCQILQISSPQVHPLRIEALRATFWLFKFIQTLSCGMWNLVPWPGMEPWPPALRAKSFNHRRVREVQRTFISKYSTNDAFIAHTGSIKIQKKIKIKFKISR